MKSFHFLSWVFRAFPLDETYIVPASRNSKGNQGFGSINANT